MLYFNIAINSSSLASLIKFTFIGSQSIHDNSVFCGAFGTCLSMKSINILVSFIQPVIYLTIRSSSIVAFGSPASFCSWSFVIDWYCNTKSMIFFQLRLRSRPAFLSAGSGCQFFSHCHGMRLSLLPHDVFSDVSLIFIYLINNRLFLGYMVVSSF